MDDAGRLAWAAGGPGGRHHKQSCFQGMLVATSLGLQKTVFDFQVPFCPTFCRSKKSPALCMHAYHFKSTL